MLFPRLGFIAIACLLPPAATHAEDAPKQPIHFVVGFPPGGSVDLLARSVADQLSRKQGVPVVVENHPGASTNIAAESVARAPADGHTVLVASDSLAINRSLFKRITFDPVASFAPVTLAILAPQVLALRPGLGVHGPAEYVQKVRAAPHRMSIALTGTGTIGHLISESINRAHGLAVNHVPYTGGAAAARDVVGGHVDGLYITLPAITSLLRSGELTPVGIASPKRSPALPDVPTFAETIMPGFELDSWQGFLLPAGAPAEVVGHLNHAIADALHSDPVARPLRDLGYEIVASTPEQFSAVIAADVVRFGDIVRASRLQLD